MELFGVKVDEPLDWKVGRNADIREVSLVVDGEERLRFCQAYGFRNIQNIVRRVKSGKCPYQLIEVMACPGGCANGGGQPRPPPLEAATRKQRVEELVTAHAETKLRAPLDNPTVQELYSPGGYLAGGPLGEAATRRLLTQFHTREGEINPLGIKW